MRLTVLALTLISLAQTGASAAAAKPWPVYHNQRFGFSTCHPPEMRALGESQNGDGQAFASADGAKLIAWGGFDVLDEELDDLADKTVKRFGGQAAYRAGSGNWRVVSGTQGASEYYARIVRRGDVDLRFELMYPKAAAKKWRPLVGRIAGCFKAEDKGWNG